MSRVVTEINRSSGSNRVYVFIHPLGGTTFCFMSLLKMIGFGEHALLIKDRFLLGDYRVYQSIREMAQYYLSCLLGEQIDWAGKELSIVGYSLGALIGYELTRLLEGFGITVQNLIVIDAWPKFPFAYDLHDKIDRIISRQMNQLRLDSLSEYQENLETWYGQMKNRLACVMGFRPDSKVSVDIVLLRAIELLPEYHAVTDYDYGWSAFITPEHRVRVLEVFGSHETLLTVENIRRSLDEGRLDILRDIFS